MDTLAVLQAFGASKPLSELCRPTIGGLVAITGANGTIGYACVLRALHIGYRIRCIVRREVAIAQIQHRPSMKQFADKIEYAIVPDNTVPGAYNKALEGAKYVIHIAGVWPRPNYHPDNEVYLPFVRSMENILSAAEKAGTVRRVVLTQAGAGLVNPDDGDGLGTRMDRILNEHVDIDIRSAAFRPPLKSPHHGYCGAKAYCMSYLRGMKDKFPFSIVQVIPGTVMGPSELVTSAAEAYAQMDRMSKAILFNEMKPRYAFGFVHIDDCARVHVEALGEAKVPTDVIPDWFVAAASTVPGKNGEQIWNEVGDMVEQHFAKEVGEGLLTVGRDNSPVNMPFRVESRLTERLLLDGKQFKSLEDCVKDVGQWYAKLVDESKSA